MLLCHAAGSAVLAAGLAGTDLPRDDDPVLVLGSALSVLDGMSLSRIGVFRWNSSSTAFEPIPFQIDERVATTFNPGTPYQFTETIYDVLHQDDGRLDADDELAVLMGDAGPQAPGTGYWVAGADPERFEIRVVSALPGQSTVTRWVYVFTGDELPRSSVAYVQWDRGECSPVTTTTMTLEYTGRWLLTGIRVNAPCGSGADLIDRVKGRATTFGGNQEDEENWSRNSEYLGGLVGPVRAIRYVRGATSGINTIHHDVVYRRLWGGGGNLRVHPLSEVSLYIDWRAAAGAVFYSSSVPTGVPVDGEPDAVPATYVPWFLTRSPDGGLAVVNEVPPSPRYQTRSSLYRDDADYDDEIPGNPVYGDEDDFAYGNQGVRLQGLVDSTLDAIALWTIASPLCSNFGDASTGEMYREFFDQPFQVQVAEQQGGLGAVRSLLASRDGGDVVLSWESITGATSFNIYRTPRADDPRGIWTLVGTAAGTTYRDVGTAYYSVVAVGASGEGGW